MREGDLAAASNPETGMAIPFEDLMRGSHHLSFHRPISPGFITVHRNIISHLLLRLIYIDGL